MDKLKKIIEFGFYLFLFLLPWQTRLIWHETYLNGFVWEYGRFSLYGTEILLWLILLLYGFWLIKNRHLPKFEFDKILIRLTKPAVSIYWLLVLFLGLAGVSIIWSLDAQLAYIRWFTLLEAMALLSLVLVFGFKLEKIAVVWVSSAAIQGIFAIWQFFTQYVFANKWLGLAEHFSTLGGAIILQTNSERWLRAYGSLPHPNILAGFLVVGILLLLYLALIAKKQGQRIFVLVSLIAIMPALFFSFSRSGWVALIFSLTILTFWLVYHRYYLWRNTFFKILLLTLIIYSVLGSSLWQPLLTRISGEQDLEVASIYLRVAFTKQAWEIIKTNPWQGTGIGDYTLGVYQIVNSSWPGYYYQPVHNIYLLVLAELGILGALLFILILGLLFWNLIKTKIVIDQSPQHLEKVIVFLCLISVLIISLFDHYFWTFYFGVMIFWLILGLNLRQLNFRNKDLNTS
ncbi:MAG: O-antigen ligase family protein [Patescibacteria group bacterium]|jgi:hypothetical protein